MYDDRWPRFRSITRWKIFASRHSRCVRLRNRDPVHRENRDDSRQPSSADRYSDLPNLDILWAKRLHETVRSAACAARFDIRPRAEPRSARSGDGTRSCRRGANAIRQRPAAIWRAAPPENERSASGCDRHSRRVLDGEAGDDGSAGGRDRQHATPCERVDRSRHRHVEHRYRRLGDAGGGWPRSFRDVASAADFLRTIASKEQLDLNRVVSIGHSAGGHFALWLAGRKRISKDSELYTANPPTMRRSFGMVHGVWRSEH